MNSRINYLDNINFKDKVAIVRVDFNVPLSDNLIISDVFCIVSRSIKPFGVQFSSLKSPNHKSF